MSSPDEQPRIHRRDLICGKLWKLVRPASRQPLWMRCPTPDSQLRHNAPEHSRLSVKPKTIQGIAIEAVPPTRLTNLPARQVFPVFRQSGAVDEHSFPTACSED